MLKKLFLAISTISLLLVMVGPVSAQKSGGSSLAGQVTCSGTPEPGSVVKVYSSNGSSTTATTDASGNYVLYLHPGTYSAGVVYISDPTCIFFNLYQPISITPNHATILNFNF